MNIKNILSKPKSTCCALSLKRYIKHQTDAIIGFLFAHDGNEGSKLQHFKNYKCI